MNKFFTLALLFVFNIQANFAQDNQFPSPYFVGELGEQWTFPSDHLPVGGSINNQIHFACWNILNKNAMHYIENNCQGLAKSSLVSENVLLNDDEDLTIREIIILDMIIRMIENPTHPRSLIGLSEVNQNVLSVLKTILPPSWTIIHPDFYSENTILFDSDIFECVDTQAIYYTLQRSKSIITVSLREKECGTLYKFILTHIPGGPFTAHYSIREFAYEVFQQFDPHVTTVLMGDMNHQPKVIYDALEDMARRSRLPNQPFKYYNTSYPTHIDTVRNASWFDSFFIYSPTDKSKVTISNHPLDFFDEMSPVITLLNSYK